MNNKTFKTIPLLTLLSAGLMLSSPMAMADKGDREHSKEYSSHHRQQSHNNDYRRDNKHAYFSHKGNHRSEHRYDRDNRHNSHSYYRPKEHYEHRYNRHVEHRSYPHTTYIVNDHYYSDYGYRHGYILDNLGFMIGLHTNNFDVTFRD